MGEIYDIFERCAAGAVWVESFADYRELPNAWLISTPHGPAIILRIAFMMPRWLPNFPHRHISSCEPSPTPIRRWPHTAGTVSMAARMAMA